MSEEQLGAGDMPWMPGADALARRERQSAGAVEDGFDAGFGVVERTDFVDEDRLFSVQKSGSRKCWSSLAGTAAELR